MFRQLSCRQIFAATLARNTESLIKRLSASVNTGLFDNLVVDLNNDKLNKYLESLRLEFYNLRTQSNVSDFDHQRIRNISKTVEIYEQKLCVLQNLNQLTDLKLKEDKDEEMKKLVEEESQVYCKLLKDINEKLVNELLEVTNDIKCSSVIFEVSAGVGGQEAMLFAKDLYEMYSNFLNCNNWNCEILDEEFTDIGGLRHASMLVEGANVFKLLEHEAGVHRVQRVPATEKSGRIHTSTVSVSVVPRPDNVKIKIEDKDLKIETKRASGAGGQHVNTTDSAVRITHLPSGTVVECQVDRSQVKNRQIALKKLENSLIQKKCSEQDSEKRANKKLQVGSSNRNEKIRTYNYPQDRITDHRLKCGTFHNLKEFLAGGEQLKKLIIDLNHHKRTEELLKLINTER